MRRTFRKNSSTCSANPKLWKLRLMTPVVNKPGQGFSKGKLVGLDKGVEGKCQIGWNAKNRP